jgi:hypothetical protein
VGRGKTETEAVKGQHRGQWQNRGITNAARLVIASVRTTMCVFGHQHKAIIYHWCQRQRA